MNWQTNIDYYLFHLIPMLALRNSGVQNFQLRFV